MIGVKGYPRTALNSIFFTPAPFEVTKDIASYVLNAVAPVFGEFFVFGDRLNRAAGDFEPFA